jgi:hypothetical protein
MYPPGFAVYITLGAMTKIRRVPYVPQTRISHVRQRGEDDCGVACTAMLADISYAQAKTTLMNHVGSSSLLTKTKHLRAALDESNIRLGSEVRSSDWNQLLGLGRVLLLSTNYLEERDSNWHWCVFDPARHKTPVLDPRNSEPTQIDRRTKLFSYFLLWRDDA